MEGKGGRALTSSTPPSTSVLLQHQLEQRAAAAGAEAREAVGAVQALLDVARDVYQHGIGGAKGLFEAQDGERGSVGSMTRT